MPANLGAVQISAVGKGLFCPLKMAMGRERPLWGRSLCDPPQGGGIEQPAQHPSCMQGAINQPVLRLGIPW